MLLVTALLALLACGAPCKDSGTTYASGESWTCSDGCNTCSCEDGAVASTQMYCAATCTDETGTYVEGDSWSCPDGCNACTCEPDGAISTTDLGCL